MSDPENVELTDEDIEHGREIMSTHAKLTKRRVVEEYEGVEPKGEEVPDGDTLNSKDKQSVMKSKEMDTDQLCSAVGGAGFKGWRIEITRMGPDTYHQCEVILKKIMTMKVGKDLDGLEERIRDIHGGGEYKIEVLDNFKRTRRTQPLDIEDTEPKLRYDECPTYFDKVKEDGEIEIEDEQEDKPDLKSIMMELHDTETLKKTLLGLKDDGSKGGGDSAIKILGGMMITMMESSDRRMESMMEAFKEEKRSREVALPGGSWVDKMVALAPAFAAITPFISDYFKRSSEERRFFLESITKGNGKDESIAELYKNINEVAMSRGELNLKMISMFMENALPEDSENTKLWKMFLGMADKMINTVGETKLIEQLTNARRSRRPAIERNKPTAQKTNTAPQDKREAAQGQPQEKRRPTRAEYISSYRKADGDKRIAAVIKSCISESRRKSPPTPENSLMVMFLIDEATPVKMKQYLNSVEEPSDLQMILNAITSPGLQDLMKKELFDHVDRCEWVMECMDFLQDYYKKEGIGLPPQVVGDEEDEAPVIPAGRDQNESEDLHEAGSPLGEDNFIEEVDEEGSEEEDEE